MPDLFRIDDKQAARNSLEFVTTKFNIGFLVLMVLVSGGLFVVGLVMLIPVKAQVEQQLKAVPDSVLLCLLGWIGFALFFPWMTSLFFARYFLAKVKELEGNIDELRVRVASLTGQR